MKKKFFYKKSVIGSLLTLSILPIATVVACSETQFDYTKPSDIVIGDLTAQDYEGLVGTPEKDAISSSFLNQIRDEAVEILYKKEQQSSIEMQKIWISWDVKEAMIKQVEVANDILGMPFTIVKPVANTDVEKIEAIKKLVATNFPEAERSKYNTLRAQFDTRQTEVDRAKEKIEKINNNAIDFNNTTELASSYPRILKPFEKEKETQTKVYNEKKTAFIETYSSAADGEIAWVNKRSEDYGGAKTDDDAIQFLVSQNTYAKAFGEYTISINNSFTVEQFNATDENGKKIFPWFEGEKLIQGQEVKAEDGAFWTKDINDKKGLIYFIYRNTNNPEKFAINKFDAITFGNWNTSSVPVTVSHTVIDIKPNAENPKNAWTATKATVKKIMSWYGSENDPKQAIDLFKDVFDRNKQKETDLFIDYFGSEEAGRGKSGNMGVKSLSEYVSQMDPGFSMGVLAALSDRVPNNITNNFGQDFGLDILNGPTIINNLVGGLKDLIKDVPSIQNARTTTEKNRALEDWVDSLSDEVVTNRFGTVFREELGNKINGSMYAYRINGTSYLNGSYLVVSSFGLHMISVEDLSPTTRLQESIEKDLNKIAYHNSLDKSETGWNDVFKKIYTNEFIVSKLLENLDDGSESELKKIVNNLEQTKPDLYKEWIDKKFIIKNPDGNYENVANAAQRMIVSLEQNNAISSANTSLGDKMKTFVEATIINQTRNEKIIPEKVYENALIRLGIKNI